MENRLGKIMISSVGGTAGKNSKTYKVSLPSTWMNELGISENDRDVLFSFDGNQICISHCINLEEFKNTSIALGHEVFKYTYYDDEKVCSVICVDFTSELL